MIYIIWIVMVFGVLWDVFTGGRETRRFLEANFIVLGMFLCMMAVSLLHSWKDKSK